jgi:nickel-dependent lactate racemase
MAPRKAEERKMHERNHLDLAYGKGTIPLHTNPGLAQWSVLRPGSARPLADPQQAFRESCSRPAGVRPLNDIISPGDHVVIVTSDGTRPVPNRQLIPWILEVLPTRPEDATALLGNGTHRENSPEEIIEMFGKETAAAVRIVNHDGFAPEANVCVGRTPRGKEVHLDKLYVEAEKRIVVGFIEPHFFAGFSGGAKGVVPGVASADTIFHIHRAELIADPLSTWGEVEHNPLRQEIEEMVRLCPPDFLVNVSLNEKGEISGLFMGDYIEAHRRGCKHVRERCMVPVSRRFPVVVTTNGGFPLDRNLYQTVKGISAAERIVEDGGTIIVASECRDGVPDHGDFARLMHTASCAKDLLDTIMSSKETTMDQWEAQVLARILTRAQVLLHSSLPQQTVEACGLCAVDDLQSAVEEKVRSLGEAPAVAVLPAGPLTVPCVVE